MEITEEKGFSTFPSLIYLCMRHKVNALYKPEIIRGEAMRLGRRAALIELVPQFIELIRKRCQGRIEVVSPENSCKGVKDGRMPLH